MGLDITGIGSAFDFAGKLVDRFIPDPAQKAAAALQLFQAQQAGEFKQLDQAFALAQGQIDVDKVEAASGSVFVAGWRPFVGWVSGIGMGYSVLFEPLMRFVSTVIFGYHGAFPVIDTTITLQVLMVLLGMGALRTVDKIKGVATK